MLKKIVMKKIGISLLLTATLLFGLNQYISADIQSEPIENKSVNADLNTKVTIGPDLLSVEGNDSSLNLRVGNRGLNMLESLEGPKVKFEKYSRKEERRQEENEQKEVRHRTRFKGHWSGLELGFNNYLTSDRSLVLPTDIDYMSINSSKSINFNLNFTQLSLGLSQHIGFVTGLGVNFNNYRFNGNNNIQKGVNGEIEILDPESQLKKSKLATIYLNLPFLLEIQIPADNNHIHLAAGPIGAVRIGSHTKMVHEDGPTVKADGDFSLNMLRYGGTARVGFGSFQLYGTYYLTPLFQEGKSPENVDLYPFEIGIALTFND
jgi:hypothetical protein